MLVYVNRAYGIYSANTQYNLDEATARGLINNGIAQIIESDFVNAQSLGKAADFGQYQSANALKNRARPRIGCMGDSIASLNTSAGSSYAASGWLNWAQARLGQPWYFPIANNFAVAGTSTDVVVGTQLPLVLASHAAFPISRVFISTGTNDGGSGLTVPQRKQYMSTLLGSLIDAGITPMHIGILPRGNDGAMTGPKRQNMQMNEWMADYAYVKGGFDFVDCGSALANTANAFGNALVAMTDGTQLHPIDPGGFHMGTIIANYYAARGVGSMFRAASQGSDIYNATDNPYGVVFDNANPLMIGGGSGTAPSGMTISPATTAWQWGGTRTLANGQTRPVGVLTLGASANHFLYQDAVASGAFDTENIRSGDYVYAQAEVQLTGTTGVTVLNLELVENDGSTQVDSKFLADGTGGIPNITGPQTFYLRTAPILIRPYSGVGNASVFCKFNVTTSSGGGTVQVNSFELRKWVGEL